MDLPFLTFCDINGKVYSHPHLRMAIGHFDEFFLPKEKDLIKMPQGSTLFYLPGRSPVGFNLETNRFEVIEQFCGKKVFACTVFLIPAYLRLGLPACVIRKKQILPFWAYTACGFKNGYFYVAAMPIDRRVRQSPRFYNRQIIYRQVKQFLKTHPQNRLYKHLANCSLNYNCLAAKNLFLQRWEAPLPTARFCNARCLGCLSYQESGCLVSHKRINFRPSSQEISEVAINHLKTAREAIVSFGQGCEGEPLLEAQTIAKAINAIRNHTSRGTINMNTNASLPKKIELLCKIGMDSFRVSLNSPVEKFYNLYFKPKGYRFNDVLKSIEIAKKHRKFVSLNVFMFPGLTDGEFQIKALINLIKNTGINMVQCRNLNIDQELYWQILPKPKLKPKGLSFLIKILQKEFPKIKLGYFNLPKESFIDFENVVV